MRSGKTSLIHAHVAWSIATATVGLANNFGATFIETVDQHRMPVSWPGPAFKINNTFILYPFQFFLNIQ